MTDPTDPFMAERAALRRHLLDRRQQLQAEQLLQASLALLRQLQHWFNETDTPWPRFVAGYQAFDGEIDPAPSLTWLRQQGATTTLPVLRLHDGLRQMKFAPFTADTPLRTGHFGIHEPDVPDSQLLDATELDLVLLPMVGFDTRGNRLGMGGGYYDRTFAFRQNSPTRPPRLIGIAHDFQQLDQLATESWDVPVDVVLTDVNRYTAST